ncbi:hypothetical protein SMD44_08307 [Streptomyces alboflavus]|uniref:Uncharacterized protein n=1 Tax=Streptomyces alboflavus TaxID=67267 RepID=A0A1Z1WQY5_9ACTN|nr:hypothetical protein SMD44_08307 [Streptomyces alboflavus]
MPVIMKRMRPPRKSPSEASPPDFVYSWSAVS